MQSIRFIETSPENSTQELMSANLPNFTQADYSFTRITAAGWKKQPIFLIDPARLGDEINDEALHLFLTQMHDQDINHISTESLYAALLIDPKTSETNSYQVKLTRHLIKRKCSHDENVFHYDVLQDLSKISPIEQGGFGKIVDIDYTLTPQTRNEQLVRKSKKKLFKVQHADISDQQTAVLNMRWLFKRTIQEFQLTPNHIGMKPPIFIDNISLMPMPRISGCTLETLLLKDSKKNILTVDDRFSLALNVLRALKSQVHDQDLVHRDLKSSNVMVDRDRATGEWIVKIIDFGLAKRADESDIDRCDVGTLAYQSPESYYNEGTSKKSDVYAAGCLIAEIFGCCRLSCCLSDNDIIEALDNQPIARPGIFDFIDNRRVLVKRLIENLIDGMTDYSIDTIAEHRYTTEEAIQSFEKIILRRECIQTILDFVKNRESHISFIKSHTLLTRLSHFQTFSLSELEAQLSVADKMIDALREYKTTFDSDEILLINNVPQLRKIAQLAINQSIFEKNARIPAPSLSS